jgi:hypothetical protein
MIADDREKFSLVNHLMTLVDAGTSFIVRIDGDRAEVENFHYVRSAIERLGNSRIEPQDLQDIPALKVKHD